ncbi:MFS transporter [Amycolatopsis sp. NPDC058278]|uniref:MFS transporter n=1 Tax=Amycolatopsis sp. NPDC058278 TaxID=3346417 RepID=UPI0036D81147
MVAFVLVERRVRDPLLPLRVVLDRDRGAAYLTIGISGTGGFAVFNFVTYYLAQTLKFTPVQSGLAFLPMAVLVMAGAVVSGAVLLPRVGPRPIVPIGSLLAAVGMVLLTGIDAGSTYPGGVLPALLVIGLGLGLIFGPGQNAATSGVLPHETGVASALANITQQVGGSIGLAVFSSLGATATAGHFAAHAGTATDPDTIAQATFAGYHVVFRIAAALFLGGAVLSAGLFLSGPLTVDPEAEPVLIH